MISSDRYTCTHYLVGQLMLSIKHWTLNFFVAFAVFEFFCVLCFSFGSGYISCKAYDDGLSFRNTDNEYGIYDSSWLVTFN